MAMSRSHARTKGDLLHLHGIGRRGLVLGSIVALCIGLGASGASASSTHAAGGLTIFAGSSMTQVLQDIDPTNTYSFGSTTTLGTQITNGAPADVLMGANTTQCASMYAAGTVLKPKSNPAGITSIYDLTKPGVTVDVAATSVPVGSYTVQVLNQMGLNTAVQANVVSQETSDANVVQKVALGQVDAGFVYLSDYVIDPKDLTLITVPAWAQPKITYAMCIVAKSSNQAAAAAWQNEMLTPKAQAIFVKDGFISIYSPVPTITKVSVAKVKPGGTLTLTGTNFKTTTSVTFQGVPAKYKANSNGTLTVTVPTKAKTGALTVTNPNGSATWKLITIG
jgi:molybdate transport system substrate-binding protein